MTHTVEMLVAWVMKTGNLDYIVSYVGCLLRMCMILLSWKLNCQQLQCTDRVPRHTGAHVYTLPLACSYTNSRILSRANSHFSHSPCVCGK